MLTNHFVSNALFIGFAATLITSIFMVLARARGKKVLDLHLFFGRALFGNKCPENCIGAFALVLHLLIGTGLGLIYMWQFPKGILSGIVFSLIAWLVMGLVLFPIFKQGIFANELDKIKVKGKKKPEYRKVRAWMLTLIFHLIYGVILGWFATF